MTKIKELAARIKEFWNGKPPERVIYYGLHLAVWGGYQEIEGSCWYCAWCGHNASDESWTDNDAYAQGVMHALNEHPGVEFETVQEHLVTPGSWM